MVDQWYFAWGAHKFGPFSSVEMRQLAGIGRLQPEDTVWKQGVEAGVAASRIKNLFEPAAAPAAVLAAENLTDTAVPPEAGPAADADEPMAEAEKPSLSDSDYPMPLATDGPPAVAEGMNGSQEAPRPAAPSVPAPANPRPTKAMVTGVRGCTLLSQDGRVAQVRKKCDKCGQEDISRSTIPIRNGTARSSFFCRKCRKATAVEVRGKV